MRVQHIPCAPFVNESEKTAVLGLKERLVGLGGTHPWIILSNVSIQLKNQRLPDEIDMIVVGPTGIHTVEIKHWDGSIFKRGNIEDAESEANKIADKTRRLAGRIRNDVQLNIGFLEPKILCTKNTNEKFVDSSGRKSMLKVELFGLNEWRELLQVSSPALLTADQIERIVSRLVPRATATISENIRYFGQYYDLEATSGHRDSFHRVFRGKRRGSNDRVILNLYDLTAVKDKNSEDIARREYDIYQMFQKSPWIPNIMDSFQSAAGYPGELCFFSYIDPEAPRLSMRCHDPSWGFDQRLYTARKCITALKEMHDHSEGILHRNLTPDTIHIRSDNQPIFSGLQAARITGASTVLGSVSIDFEGHEQFVAPEVRTSGLSACTPESDVYSLCASLRVLFEQLDANDDVENVLGVLDDVLVSDPENRATLSDLLQNLSDPGHVEVSSDISPIYWDEATVKRFGERYYRVVSRLGSGSVGVTFKVMEVEPKNKDKEIGGPFLAKAITNSSIGPLATAAYARVRAQTRGNHIASVLEVGSEWRQNEITALMYWCPGSPLLELKGILPLHIEELGEMSIEDTILGWINDLCEGLSELHRSNLVHGDVSPKNILIEGSVLTLTDYDLAALVGTEAIGGTTQYCSPSVDRREKLACSDDIYALAASMFDVLFERPPFEISGRIDKSQGINWDGIEKGLYPKLSSFFDHAMQLDPKKGISSAMEAMEILRRLETPPKFVIEREPELGDHRVEWLSLVLQSYPGSPKGNAETRGLDSVFARTTYIETDLDRILLADIKKRKVNLVILCGNAGDGKTAFLQHLAEQLNIHDVLSAKRAWDVNTNGLRIRANMDGSAALEDKSAKQLLDEFFSPFRDGAFPKNLVHLLAINDGPLLAWLEDNNPSWLYDQLYIPLTGGRHGILDDSVRFIDFNTRSLVGGYTQESNTLNTDFVEGLLSKLVNSKQTWEQCSTCTAKSRCSVKRSIDTLQNCDIGSVVQSRLSRLLQCVHMRGRVHITARLLRAVLSYIFFGTDECTDLHNNPNYRPMDYWDRAFDVGSPFRQGDLLAEFQMLDPALGSDPRIDRELLREGGTDHLSPAKPGRILASLRRNAFFEWSDTKLRQVSGGVGSIDLRGGHRHADFLKVGVGSDTERREICSRLCRGLARLEDLPPQAFERPDFVPIRVTPRTPTETAFWIYKPRERFELKTEEMKHLNGLDILHTGVILTYHYESGHIEDLVMGLDLFTLLLDLDDGYQIVDVSSDETYANLAIFRQRLAQEDDTTLYAWNPLEDRAYCLSAELRKEDRKLVLTSLKEIGV